MTESRCQDHFMIASGTEQNLQLAFRLTPTPSRFIHRGNAGNFLCVWHFARFKKGRIQQVSLMRSILVLSP
jgi:hypothetical protein